MKKRVISSIVMILITIPFVILGSIYFSFFALIVGEMALYEFLKFRKKISISIKILTHIMLALYTFKDILKIQTETLIIISILLFLGSLVLVNDKTKYHYKDAFYLVGLVIFLGIIFSNIIYIRNIGFSSILYLLIIATSTDTFALLVGKSIGKRKLAPTISPNKTIEGLIGGVLFGTIISSIFYLIFVKNITNIIIVFGLTMILSVVGEYGDLIKSSIKRNENIKDFSNLIPGHGGIMDRIDSFSFIVLVYILIINLGGLL